jgi:hypothetical protein
MFTQSVESNRPTRTYYTDCAYICGTKRSEGWGLEVPGPLPDLTPFNCPTYERRTSVGRQREWQQRRRAEHAEACAH